MKRYPLHMLLRLREHRVEQARQELLRRRERAQACRDACVRIEGEIIALQHERDGHRARLLEPPPAGLMVPQALTQREAHIGHLEALADAARRRLFEAQEVLRQAELELQAAREAWSHARARLEALEKRHDLWRRERVREQLRLEENTVADLLQARPAGTRAF